VRSARLLGVLEPVMPALTETVSELMSPSYPELKTDLERIRRVAVKEEESFLRTIASGSRLFDVAAEETKDAGSTVVPGSTAFVLHDTQGFPIDLTLEMAAEAGLTVDTDEFRRLMDEQRQRARADAKARKGKFADLSVYRRPVTRSSWCWTGHRFMRNPVARTRTAASLSATEFRPRCWTSSGSTRS
jgi:alanyl-tRNA synthetase